MEPQKRSWIYGGIAHPPNVVLARPRAPQKRLPAGSSLLLVGDEHAWGLAPFLKLLSRDADVAFGSLCASGSLSSWPYLQALPPALNGVNLLLVSLALVPSDAAAVQSFAAAARNRGAAPVWLRPPQHEDAQVARVLLDASKVPSFHTEALDLARGPDGAPSARGYAGWAGALWRWIG